jgi:hypothetical protein
LTTVPDDRLGVIPEQAIHARRLALDRSMTFMWILVVVVIEGCRRIRYAVAAFTP